MKKFFLSMAMVTIVAASFASVTNKERTINYRAQQNLADKFGAVAEVEWTPTRHNGFRAKFTQDDEVISAFFDRDGGFIAATHDITFKELPGRVRVAIRKKFASEAVSNIFELTNDQETAYYFETLVNGKRQVWKSDYSGNIVMHNL